MTSDSTKAAACSVDGLLFDNWFDPIETALRERARSFIEELIHGELTAALDRPRYGRRGMKESPSALVGHRHGSRTRSLTGTFGTTEITVPRARIEVRTVRRRSGRARRCGPINAARWLLMP